MKPEPSLTVSSLGGGVQSSVMALMANEEESGRLKVHGGVSRTTPPTGQYCEGIETVEAASTG